MRKRMSGFTIIEILVVIAVIGILTTISVVSFTRYQADARDSQRAQRASVISSALEKYYSTHGEYPSCSTMTSSAATVSTALPGIDPTALITPQAATNKTNSIDLCVDLSTSTPTDSFAYVGDGSAACSGNQSCLQYTLEYKQESTGTIQKLLSRHNTNIATSGNITNLSGAPQQFSSINLTWGAITNASTYTVQTSTDSGFGTIINNSTGVTATSLTVSALTPGTPYWFRVAANAPNSQSNWSNTLAVTMLHIATPGSPSAVDDGTNPASQLDFSWASVSGVSSYSLDYSTSSTFASAVTTINGLTSTSYNVTGLAAGTTLYFRVKALAPDDVSSYTSTVNSTTVVPVPTGNAIAINNSTTFTQTWNAVGVAASYTFQCSTDNATWGGCQGSVAAPTTNHVYGGAGQGQAYYVRVQAVTASGAASAWSASAGGTTPVDAPTGVGFSNCTPNAGNQATTIAGHNWIGTNANNKSGSYYYARCTASGSCGGGSMEIYITGWYATSAGASHIQQTSSGWTVPGDWYFINGRSSYLVYMTFSAHCNANGNWSGQVDVGQTAGM